MEYVITVNGLRIIYEFFQISDLNIKVKEGVVTGFIGPNGSGKSTTIKAMLNLIYYDKGEIKIFNEVASQKNARLKERMGIIMDEGYFYEDLPLGKMKNIISSFYSKWDEKLFNKYLAWFKLNPASKINSLSKGMRMKFSICLALSRDADLFIMDEPTSGLDPVVREEFIDILHEISKQEGKSIFFSSHITSDIEKICKDIIYIYDGNIILSDSKAEILGNHLLVHGGREIILSDTGQSGRSYSELLIIGYKEVDGCYTALINKKNAAMFNGLKITDPTIEDIMLLYARGLNREADFRLA